MVDQNGTGAIHTASPDFVARAHVDPQRYAAMYAASVADPAAFFTPLDRIGQLQMRNLDILDSRDKLGVYARVGVLPANTSAAGLLEDKTGKKD